VESLEGSPVYPANCDPVQSLELIQTKQFQHETDNDDKADDINNGIHLLSLSSFRGNSIMLNVLPSLHYRRGYQRAKGLQIRKEY
jgi:hypothetical protein